MFSLNFINTTFLKKKKERDRNFAFHWNEKSEKRVRWIIRIYSEDKILIMWYLLMERNMKRREWQQPKQWLRKHFWWRKTHGAYNGKISDWKMGNHSSGNIFRSNFLDLCSIYFGEYSIAKFRKLLIMMIQKHQVQVYQSIAFCYSLKDLQLLAFLKKTFLLYSSFESP